MTVELLHKKLIKKKLTISVAESCTGGLLSKLITDVPGSSKYYYGSTIAYKDDVKIKHLKVSKESINKYGAVSKETAEEMAKNILDQDPSTYLNPSQVSSKISNALLDKSNIFEPEVFIKRRIVKFI